MKEKTDNPRFYIFIDDLQWAREKYKGEHITFVDGNRDNSSYVDMFLMSQCKHNIVANSTFSWWGAWLNDKEDKKVVAPSQWFGNQECNDIYTEEMIKISSKGLVVDCDAK